MVAEVTNDVCLDVLACCSLDQQVGESSIVGVDDLTAVSAVVVEDPLGQKKGCSFVAFSKPLSARYTECKSAGRFDRIGETID